MAQTKQRTLFKKYLRITLSIVLASFLLLGMVMLVFVSYYWEGEKRTALNKNADYIAQMAEVGAILYSDGSYEFDSRMEMLIQAYSDNADADILITDTSGNLILGKGESVNAESQNVDPSIMWQVTNGGYQGQGTLSGIYRENYYIVGKPVIINNTPVAAVFVASSIQSLSAYRMEILRMFLLAAIAAFMVTFCVVWVFSYQLVKPLRQMSAAAKSFGEGDFSTRVPVTSSDEIGELATAFNNMAASLASGESMRRNFIANVSHELKTPMTTIAGFAEGILDGTIPPEKERDALNVVVSETRRLSRLVRRMLDLSRLNALAETVTAQEQFDITEIMSRVLVSLEGRITDRGLDVDAQFPEDPVMVWGDPDGVTQVCYNLLDNAAKFAAQGTSITVQITKKDGKAYIAVRNLGATIPPDELPLLFDRFHKADSSRSIDREGVGLGLYIVKTILGNLKENITVTSEDGVTQFIFTLTLA